MSRYFIQPGDRDIKFDMAVTLEEIKHLHSFALTQEEVNSKAGYIVKSNMEMIAKLDGLINYLQSEHYQNL